MNPWVKIGLFLLVVETPAQAAWKSEDITAQDLIQQACGGSLQKNIHGVEIEVPEFDKLLRFTNKASTVDLCYTQESLRVAVFPAKKVFSNSYALRYLLSGSSDKKLLVSEAEVMAWPLDYSLKGQKLEIFQSWDARRVKTYTFDCRAGCTLQSACEIQKLSSDSSDIVAAVQPDLKKPLADRAAFVLGDDVQKAPLMHQLFVEAGSGNAKAIEAMTALSEGLDAAAGEVIGIYLDEAKTMQRLGCKWGL